MTDESQDKIWDRVLGLKPAASFVVGCAVHFFLLLVFMTVGRMVGGPAGALSGFFAFFVAQAVIMGALGKEAPSG